RWLRMKTETVRTPNGPRRGCSGGSSVVSAAESDVELAVLCACDERAPLRGGELQRTGFDPIAVPHLNLAVRRGSELHAVGLLTAVRRFAPLAVSLVYRHSAVSILLRMSAMSPIDSSGLIATCSRSARACLCLSTSDLSRRNAVVARCSTWTMGSAAANSSSTNDPMCARVIPAASGMIRTHTFGRSASVEI